MSQHSDCLHAVYLTNPFQISRLLNASHSISEDLKLMSICMCIFLDRELLSVNLFVLSVSLFYPDVDMSYSWPLLS